MSIDGTREQPTSDAAAAEPEAPKTTAPETEAPKTTAPETEAPKTTAPETEAPKTAAPGTSVEASSGPEGSSDHYADADVERKKRRRPRGLGDPVFCRPLEVIVRDDRVEQAIRQLKNRMAREGVLRELKNRRHYFKPSELKRIKSREAARRRRKQARQKGAH